MICPLVEAFRDPVVQTSCLLFTPLESTVQEVRIKECQDFFDAVASPSTYPCWQVGGRVMLSDFGAMLSAPSVLINEHVCFIRGYSNVCIVGLKV